MNPTKAQREARRVFEQFKRHIEYSAATHSHEDGLVVPTELVKVSVVVDHFLKSKPEYASCRDYLIGCYDKRPESAFNIKRSALTSEPRASVPQLAEI